MESPEAQVQEQHQSVLTLRDLTTQKEFSRLPMERAVSMTPTGLYDYRRVSLADVFPDLEGVNLYYWWFMRVGCCAHQIVRGSDRLKDCDRCRDNHGYVCPVCLGAAWVIHPYKPCPGCTTESVGARGELVSRYDAEKERRGVEMWIARHFPMGVPLDPSYEDVMRMDRY